MKQYLSTLSLLEVLSPCEAVLPDGDDDNVFIQLRRQRGRADNDGDDGDDGDDDNVFIFVNLISTTSSAEDDVTSSTSSTSTASSSGSVLDDWTTTTSLFL